MFSNMEFAPDKSSRGSVICVVDERRCFRNDALINVRVGYEVVNARSSALDRAERV